jgi:FtsP/CotA-like multicopper oxidase with cupredoxin domain
MGMRAHRRTAVIAAVGVVAAAGVAGSWAGVAATRHAAHPATHVRRAPVWIAGERHEAAPVVAPARRAVRHAQVVRPAAAVRHTAAHRRVVAPRARTAKRPHVATATLVFRLCAKAGTATMPGGGTVPIWGFVRLPVGNTCASATLAAQLPGPVLEANAGDSVTLAVTNTFTDRALAIEVPGVDFAPGPQTVAAGATVSVTFTAVEGSYLYDSSAEAGRQEAMGLYGALVVHPASGPGQAYGSPVDVDVPVVLSEVDPNFNAAPDTFDMNHWRPTYWLINGKGYPDVPTIDAAAGQRILLRYLNAGNDNNTMTLLGLHERLIARDGYKLANPFDVDSETFPSGATADAIVTLPAGLASGTRYPLYNRQLHTSMTTFVRVP